MPVARDHLGRDRLGREAELLCDMRFDARVDIGEGADRAGDLAGRHLPARGNQALAVARELGVVAGELDPEGRRLGVDAVAAADRRRVLVFEGALFQRCQHRVEIGEQQVGGLGELHRQAGVEHVARGHPLVDEARLRPDMLGQVGQKGDDVVMRLALDLVDARDLEGAALAHRPGRALRDDAELGLRLAGQRLDLEPDAKAVLGRPDRRHLRPAVTRDHAGIASAVSAASS